MQSVRIEEDATDLLIADYLEPDPTDPRATAYRLRGSHLPVSQVVRQVGTERRDMREVAQELGVFYKAVDAALAYHARHCEAFAMPASEVVSASHKKMPLFPWWLELFLFVVLGVVSALIGVWLAIYAG